MSSMVISTKTHFTEHFKMGEDTIIYIRLTLLREVIIKFKSLFKSTAVERGSSTTENMCRERKTQFEILSPFQGR